MSARVSRIAAVSLVVGFPAAVAVVFVIGRAAGGPVGDELQDALPMAAPFGAFALVGALVLSRRPGHVVGWICGAMGALFALSALAIAYAGRGLAASDPTAGMVLAIWIGNWTWYPVIGAATIALPLLMPDGKLVSPRWGWVALVGGVGVGGMIALAMFHPRLSTFQGDESIPNPVGMSAVPSPIESGAASVLLVLLFVAALGAFASVVVRYRRAGREDRTRLKWIVYGFSITIVLATILDVVQARMLAADGIGISNAIWAIIWMPLPASIGIAILRHRLFDIDRIVSRTVSYALVTIVLAGVYFAGVVGLGGLLRAVTGTAGGDLVVAASTLAVAAAFGPVRRRAQSAVDRRFNRARYDAQRTVGAFAQQLRDEVDLDTLATDLRAVAQQTLSPAFAAVWLPSRTR